MIYIGALILVVASLVLGVYAARHLSTDTEGYFIGSRTLNRWAVGISAGATANSGFIVVGAVGMGYSMGMSSLLYPLAWLLGDLVFWFFFSERINRKSRLDKSVTIPQLISDDVSNKSVQIIAGIIIFILLLVYASAQFIASGKALSTFIQLSPSYSMLLAFAIVISYCIWGGFRSSVWTDLFQGIAMILLTLGVVMWGFVELGGITAFHSSINSYGPEYMDLLGGRSVWPLLIFVLGFAFAGFGFSMSQPQVTTRIMAASSIEEAKKARWIYIGFLHFTWMGMCVVGMIAKVLMPELSDGETALPEIAARYFHPVFTGAVIAGMLATIFSSLDSLLVSSASALSVDLGIGKVIAPRKQHLGHQLTIVASGVIALSLSLSMEATVFQAALFAATVLAASIGSAMTIVVLKLPRSAGSLIATIITGLLVALLWRIYGLNAMISDGLVGFVAAMAVNGAFVMIENRLVSSLKCDRNS